MVVRVDVAPGLLAWASERSGRDFEELSKPFPKLPDWASGATQPTLKQIADFARATHTPVGFFFLSEPPELELPVPDFRTMPGAEHAEPSPDLLETIYLCEQRQEWYRSYLLGNRADPLGFVGSLAVGDEIVAAARQIDEAVRFDIDSRAQLPSVAEAFTELRERAEDVGVLVMVSGVVGSNTHRKLDPEEFRGFTLVDEGAPVIFVNGADAKAAQIFTLAHELVHVWLGQPALSNARLDATGIDEGVERWCNAVAAELLVPMASLKADYAPNAALRDELDRLSRAYKVSTLVVLRRIFDAEHLTWDEYQTAYRDELRRTRGRSQARGGNFYNAQPVRSSKRFARALIADTLEGRTLHRDAFRLLGVRKHDTFTSLAEHLGVS